MYGYKPKPNRKPNKKKRNKIFVRDDYTCQKCGSKQDLTIDHITPLSKGGTSDESNLQCLCLKCNKKKGNKVSNHDVKKRYNLLVEAEKTEWKEK